MTSWLRMLVAELPLLRDLPDLGGRPLPRVEADLRPAVPGWLLRLALVLTTSVLVGLATQRAGMVSGLAWTLVGIAAVATVIVPTGTVAHLAVVASGLFVAVGGHGPFDPALFALIPLAYAAVRLAWWTQRVGFTTRVELAALIRGLPRGLALVGGTAGFGALILIATGHPSPVAVIAGGLALVVLAWLLFVRSE
ncbi:MAG: hypothetical protein VB080_00415 [Propionicimonas sp.]|uniref:hypothetical protein n=1 Tax=Propionicimonas sp. TaxID=1955623 RepID=UPI002B21FDBF|nr:hypothetical protein [Propionicimonas sp.]MEA4942876.1 hypothetical protein [Propionicimonas sp.]MEA5051967.1 hypothetical protein [Propionicimonas sp.]